MATTSRTSESSLAKNAGKKAARKGGRDYNQEGTARPYVPSPIGMRIMTILARVFLFGRGTCASREYHTLAEENMFHWFLLLLDDVVGPIYNILLFSPILELMKTFRRAQPRSQPAVRLRHRTIPLGP